MREQQLIDKETVDTYIKMATQDTYSLHTLSRTDIECSWKKQNVPVVVKSISEMYPAPKNYNPLQNGGRAGKGSFLQ